MSIDWWTIGLQTVNVLILVWLLGRFFWRPVSDLIVKRQDTARQLLDDATRRKQEAEAALAEAAHARDGLSQEREAMLADARKQALQVREAELAQAREQEQAMLDQGRSALEKEHTQAERLWSERAADLGVDIAGRLAARLSGQAVQAAFADWLLAEIRALPAASLALMSQAEHVELVSAEPLDTAAQNALGARVAEVLGRPLSLRFSVDPSLIAGLELRAPHLRVTNSWRADLDRIREGLGHGDDA